MLAAADPRYRGVQIPLPFWKVAGWISPLGLRSAGFILDQTSFVRLSDDAAATPPLGAFKTFQGPATIIAALESAESPWSQPGPVQVFREEIPACGSRARITIRCADELSSIDELEVAEWADGIPTGFFVPQLVVTASIYCAVCQLHLAYSSLQIAAPELADLDRYTLEDRKITQRDDELIWSYAPDEDGL